MKYEYGIILIIIEAPRSLLLGVILETVRHDGSRSVKRKLEYDNYRRQQDREFISDFDREIKRIQHWWKYDLGAGVTFQTLTGKSNEFRASKKVTMSKTNRKQPHSSIDYSSLEEYECIELNSERIPRCLRRGASNKESGLINCQHF
jgi:hypothetical protein